MNDPKISPRKPHHPKPGEEEPSTPREIPIPPDAPDREPVKTPPEKPETPPIRDPKKPDEEKPRI